MTEQADPLVSLHHLLRFAILSGLVSIWFLIVYVGADWVTRQHTFRVPIAMPWEQSIPFFPATVVLYMSMYGLFLPAPFVFRTASQLDRFAGALLLLITIAGIGFLLIPAELTYASPPSSSWDGWFEIADTLNLTYDFVPSLHVGFAVACAAAYQGRAERWLSVSAWIWAVGVAASTLLLHQHHVIDVVGGWMLAQVCVRYQFRDERDG